MTNTILLAVDLNHASSWRKALPEAIRVAPEGSTLHVLTVIPSYGTAMVGAFFPPDFAEKAEAESAAKLKALVSENVPGGLNVETHVIHGTIYKKIIQVADKVHADLIVMAAARSEMQDYLLGPNAARVVRHAKQSVYVVRE
ncbi:MAG TPA: universal stress protein [Rhodobacterales bacterium]|nr:universal stress protein [Rhodobacterales bacterium]